MALNLLLDYQEERGMPNYLTWRSRVNSLMEYIQRLNEAARDAPAPAPHDAAAGVPASGATAVRRSPRPSAAPVGQSASIHDVQTVESSTSDTSCKHRARENRHREPRHRQAAAVDPREARGAAL